MGGCRPLKMGIVQDRFFQLGVGDLTLGYGGRAGRAPDHSSEKDGWEPHASPSELVEAVIAILLARLAIGTTAREQGASSQ